MEELLNDVALCASCRSEKADIGFGLDPLDAMGTVVLLPVLRLVEKNVNSVSAAERRSSPTDSMLSPEALYLVVPDSVN